MIHKAKDSLGKVLVDERGNRIKYCTEYNDETGEATIIVTSPNKHGVHVANVDNGRPVKAKIILKNAKLI